jgi:hypothetical protein
VLGDEAQPATSDGSRARATSGPRHAAPRKSLLTKLHVPAGKAVALAAMPTAVLMGMGLTPHLAQADPLPKNPFKPGPCVTQSDTPSPTADSKDGKDASKDSSKGKATPTPTTSPSASDADKPDPTTSPSASESGKADSAKAPAATASASPSASPSPTKSVDPLDPLGLGGLLGGLLGGGKSSDPTPAPSTASPTPDPTTSASTPTPSSTGGSSSSGGSSAKAGGDAVKSTTDAVKKAAKALKDATATATPSPSGSAATDPSTGSGSADGKQAYPCPTYDAKALADATTEGGIPLLPDAPWTLKSSMLTLYGLNYDGIVQVRTYSGAVKDVLKFTTTGIDIGDLDQTVEGPKGTHTTVKAAAGSTSTIRNGTTTLYTESLSGNLLGLVPITFTPKAPPPLTLPVLFFTDVTVINAGQFGGDLHIPGMQVRPNQP